MCPKFTTDPPDFPDIPGRRANLVDSQKDLHAAASSLSSSMKSIEAGGPSRERTTTEVCIPTTVLKQISVLRVGAANQQVGLKSCILTCSHP